MLTPPSSLGKLEKKGGGIEFFVLCVGFFGGDFFLSSVGSPRHWRIESGKKKIWPWKVGELAVRKGLVR